ncbi:MAG: type II secretion system protein [Spirochaetes bacterium]|nr:type II secretion system protein [Spirochaetota bacterium]
MAGDPAVSGNIFRLDNRGFTLIELIVAISVISLLFMLAIPRVGRMIGSQREKFAIVTGMLATAFDDAFMKDRPNFFVVYLSAPEVDDTVLQKDVVDRKNGVAVLNYVDGEFVDNRRKALQFRDFNDSFLIEDVLYANGEKVTDGRAYITYYPGGYSSNCIIHVLVNGDQHWSIKIDKHIKEPKVIRGYETFEAAL